MPGFLRLKLTDKLACQGSVTTYGVLRPEELVSCGDVLAVEDQESLTFSYSRMDPTGTVRPITAQMKAGRVITLMKDDGSFDEWKVRIVQDGRGSNGIVTVTCTSLWMDLVERANGSVGWVSDLPGPIRNYNYTLTLKTPTDIWTNNVLPACPSWVGAGTINPSVTIPTLSVSRMTPGALALAVRDYCRGVDVSCEVRLRRNGTTNYLLDLVTQVGAGSTTPLFHPSVSLVTLKRKVDATLEATRLLMKGANDPSGLPGILGRARWVVGTPSGNLLPLTDPNGGSGPVQFDSQWVGAYLLRVKTGATFAITSSTAGSGGSVTCSGGISTIAAGELVEFRLTEPGTNTRTTTTRYAISAVPDGTHITCAASNPITSDGQYTDWYAKIWTLASGGSVVGTPQRISGSVASTDVIAIASSTGFDNTMFVEFIQTDGAGEIPSYIDHPNTAADPTGYGLKVAEITRSPMGVTNWVQNSFMRTWTNGSAMPDGWSNPGGQTFGSGLSRNTNLAFVRYGIYSLKFQGEGGKTMNLQCPPIYPIIAAGMTCFVSVRVWVYFTNLTGAGAANAIVQLRTLDPSGAATGAALASVQIGGTGAPNATAPVIVALNNWVAIELVAYNLTATDAPYGLAVQLQGNGASVNVTGYLDTVEAYGFATNSTQVLEFGDATVLAQAGNSQLRTNAAPPAYYEFGVLDLERAFPSEFSRNALSLGGNVRAADIEYGIDTTVRLLRMDRDHLKPTQTKLTLSNLPVLQTNVLSVAKTTPAVAAVASTLPSSTAPGSFINAAAASTVTTASGAVVLLSNGVYLNAAVGSAGTINGATGTSPSIKITLPSSALLTP